MHFWLNGEKRDFNGNMDMDLLHYLREVEDITTAKDGCSGQGGCGACTVMMDDKAILSCRTPMSKIEGKKVTTTDGLENRIQNIFAKAFVDKGGIQCGFCIPGIVMRARAFLLKNPTPTRDEVKKAINPNICRCTGYKKIVDSIMRAAEMMKSDEEYQVLSHPSNVGEREPKYDAWNTVLGKRPFVADIKLEDMKYGALKFSDHPRAKVLKINTAKAENLAGVHNIFTAKDIPGTKVVGLIVKDWPFMVLEGETTRYIGDVLASVVADSEEIARQAVGMIEVEYEVLKPLTTVDEALAEDAPLIHPELYKDNILSHAVLKNGDAYKALEDAAYVSTGTYYTQRIEHAFLETECAIAEPISNYHGEGVRLYSQGQGIYEDRKGVAGILGLTNEQVEVIQIQNGGGFGGKEDLSVQGHTSMMAFLSGMPVKLLLSRPESINMHPKRHPMRMEFSVGCDQEGKLTCVIVEIDGDTGAYASVGMKVLERAAGHATGPYIVPNVDLVARAVYTNNVPCGAMRGFGVNQSAFAMESCIDDLCEQGGFDRFDFRYDNAIYNGSTLPTGQVLHSGVGLRKCLDALKDVYKNNKYVGLACGIKNTGIGNGMADEGQSKIEIQAADHIIISHGWTEMGQGVHTMALQTVCSELGISADIVEVKNETTEETVCGMTTSSRGTSIVGNSLIDACNKLKKDLGGDKSLSDLVGKVYRGNWIYRNTSELGKEKPGIGHETHYSYGYAAQAVVLDDEGYVKKIYAAHDAGRIMNPTLFEGQIEGAVHMGLGYALSENLECKDGRPVHTDYAKLGIIRSKDMPEVEVIGIEETDPNGPYGAKGVGEIGLVPTAPAVINAIYQYDGVRRYSLPIGIKKK